MRNGRIASNVPATLGALLLLAGLACSASSNPAGTTCSGGGDCATGLSCLDLTQPADGGCVTVGQSCSKACQADADCAALGAKFKCFGVCGGERLCAQTP